MKIWYDPSPEDETGRLDALWFSEATGLGEHGPSFSPLPTPTQVVQRLSEDPSLLAVLPLIRQGRPDIIVQASNNDPSGRWQAYDVLLSIEVTAEAPHGQNYWQRSPKFLNSVKSGVPTAYILPSNKRDVGGRQYRPTPHQSPFMGMVGHRHGTLAMHVEWPCYANGTLRTYPGAAYTPNPPHYWGQPADEGQVHAFFNACCGYLVEGQSFDDAFIDWATDMESARLDYQSQHSRGNGWRAVRTLRPTSPATVGAHASDSVLNRQHTLVLGPRRLGRSFLRTDPFTGLLLGAEEWICKSEEGELQHNISFHFSEGSVGQAEHMFAPYMGIHSEEDDCPFHNPGAFTQQEALAHMQQLEHGCPFVVQYRQSLWLTIPHSVIFNDGVWTSPYRR